jgi:ribonuclease HI
VSGADVPLRLDMAEYGEEVTNVSLKLVELQIALPKMHDIGKMQAQLQSHPELVQAQLAAATQKREERLKRQVTSKRTSPNLQWEEARQEKTQHYEHPYKGMNIDLMG